MILVISASSHSLLAPTGRRKSPSKEQVLAIMLTLNPPAMVPGWNVTWRITEDAPFPKALSTAAAD